MAISRASAGTVCSICGGALNAKGNCTACLLRTALDRSVVEGEALTSLVFGDFEVARREDGSLWELGRGAFGVTYLAVDNVLRRKVALKVIDVPAAAHGPQAVRERFLREARAAAALRHPNVAAIYQFGASSNGSRCFYAMELVEGETLETRVRRDGPLGVKLVLEIAIQVTRALVAAAAQGLIHRDLKPANIMLAGPAEVEVKVIDFGLAKAIADAESEMDLTHGEFVGTPNFASPEQFGSGPVDVRSDIYSLGATLWFALTGKTPFAGRNIEEIHRAQQSKALPIEQLNAARVPSRLGHLLKSMLAVEPAARPGTHDLAARLQRCSTQASGARRTRIAVATSVILILGVSAFFVFPSLRNESAPSNAAVSEKSIAVLPFENLSNDREDASFADGVQDDLLTKLAKIAALKVISRTSAMQYRDQHNTRQIGDALRVSHLLEGSVRKTGAWLHINAQLIDTRTDSHIWAEEYDRDLKDIFAIQSEIAQKVAEHLHAKISAAEKVAIERPPTADITAFDLYSRAKSLVLAWSFNFTDKRNLLQAADLLNQAVTHDPTFVQAYCQLAWIHDQLYQFRFDRTPERLTQAEEAIQTAFRLRPDAGEAHLARAGHLYRGYRDYGGALTELETARQTLPNDARLFELRGYIERRRPGGNQEEALSNLERAIELDPRNTYLLRQIAASYEDLRRYADEAAVISRALAVDPNNAEIAAERAWVEFNWKGDTRPLHQLIDSALATNPAAVPDVADEWLVCALAERDLAAAANALAVRSENSLGDELLYSAHFVQGLVARMAQDDAKARLAFTAARSEQEKLVRDHPDDAGALSVLGLIGAALGRKEEALGEGRRAIELVPVEKDAISGTRMMMGLARIAAWVGDKDLACEQLGRACRLPSRSVTYGRLKLLPWWDPLRGDPCFEKIVASLAPK